MYLGTCSICGGRVSLPDYYLSTVPPRPHCESCGAVAREEGPVIPMEHPQHEKPRSWSIDRLSSLARGREVLAMTTARRERILA